jgi:hypothetical protein
MTPGAITPLVGPSRASEMVPARSQPSPEEEGEAMRRPFARPRRRAPVALSRSRGSHGEARPAAHSRKRKSPTPRPVVATRGSLSRHYPPHFRSGPNTPLLYYGRPPIHRSSQPQIRRPGFPAPYTRLLFPPPSRPRVPPGPIAGSHRVRAGRWVSVGGHHRLGMAVIASRLSAPPRGAGL